MATNKHMAAAMTPHQTFRAINEAVETTIDPLGMAVPLLHAQLSWATHPQELAEAAAELSTRVLALQWHAWQRLLGLASEDVETPHPDDTRFADPVWQESATWDVAKQWYLLTTHHIQGMLYQSPGLSSRDRRRAAFWWREWLNAMAPTNFLLSNPVALQKAVETNGESLLRGMRIFLDDAQAGNIRMTRPDDFKVGINLATTPGKVVLQNRLLEVIHYAPSATQTYRTPLLIVTPWINKYYILDLTPKKSLVRFLLDQGFDVYITSWKNPDAAMADVGFDDYITEGIGAAIEAVQSIAKCDKVHAAGYCIGGAALSAYLAWANRHYAAKDVPVASASFLTTLVDYHKPGDVEVFLDEGSFKYLAHNMEQKGFLDGKEMAAAFRLLRSNSLIWHYVVHGYLYGETPPPFDVLFWNMDTTRMPAKMHTWYLRNFYLDNKLVKKDALEIAGQPIDLARIVQPVYAVAAADDHIAPWKQTFRLNNLVSGPKRYVLSSSGHIFGIVSPVVHPPKREYWVGDTERHDNAEDWRERAEHHPGSWWEDWMHWLKPQSGALGKPQALSNRTYPARADAPGTYVLES
ncbi:MAG: alpha/beta fold hydrolase [Gammaproteobacteria bacterium]|nr:alpha/beta fold hydrolase [Gammaproteobacteria bacterium]MBU3989107.1 alpha/beta fold hydrolase [Gammaproteobacteria bacterium]MBU4004876.1 alpha/beta fold hydrolase [Gammaproteobacteria bacterium]MBU4020469.1 alpha/beta fold hydrolase [Gammaproteobacteria bacterium]MBU4095545.1 alpha/beta fold hydrolase [Gammaproteobacteria bacterium]